MFDFVRRVQEAVGDTARRAVLKGAAGTVGLVASGFLTAALWSWLANDLDWGSTLASLAIGGVLLLIMIVLFSMSSRRKHEMPTTDDLKREVEARISLATDAVISRAKGEAVRVVEIAESKAHSLMDQAGSRASQLANDTEEKLFGSVRQAARTVGLSSDNLHAAEQKLRSGTRQLRQASDSNAGSITKLVGAFAVGVTLAAAINERRDHHPVHDPDDFL